MDLTSWWPRPTPEDTIAELARLQQADAASPPAAEGTALPAGVRGGGAFPPARGTGYDPAEVDELMGRLGSLSAEELAAVGFRTTRRRGYDMAAVDAALERLRREAARPRDE